MKKSFFTIIIAIIISSTSAYSQLGALRNKVKDAATKSSSEKNSSPTKTEEKTKSPSESQTSSLTKTQKDADGYIIDDPEVKKLLSGKNVYFSTDINLFADLLHYSSSFKMAGVAVTITNDSLFLFIVAQKQYQGVVSAEVHYCKKSNYYFERTNNSYAVVQDDKSILLFNSNHVESISPNKSAVENVSANDLWPKVRASSKEINKEKDAEAATKKLKADETFYKSGEVIAVKSNPQLEAQFLKILNELNAAPTVPKEDRVIYKKILLKYTDWTVEKNDLGIPLKMVYGTWAIGNYTNSKACFFQKLYMKKDYLGGGKYGNVVFDEAPIPSIISCELLK